MYFVQMEHHNTVGFGNTFPCSFCHKFETRKYHALLRHLRSIHEHDPYFRLHCKLDGCQKVYHKVDSLLHHRRKIHKTINDCDFIVADQSHDDIVIDAEPILFSAASPNWTGPGPMPSGQIQQCPPMIDEEAFARRCGMFLLAMKEKHKLPENVISETAAEFQALTQLTHIVALDKVKHILNTSNVSIPNSVDVSELLSGISPLSDSLLAVSTSSRRQQFYEGHLGLVKAVEYSAGPNKHGKVETYQYVPVTQTLKALLMNEDVQSEVFNGHSSNDGYIRDFCDGKLFSEHRGFLDNPHALQIQLYYDEFVVCNPLGNKISQCKTSAFYYVLGNLAPSQRSKLDVIQLLVLCKHQTLKTVGFDFILKPFIEEMQVLGTEGFSMLVAG